MNAGFAELAGMRAVSIYCDRLLRCQLHHNIFPRISYRPHPIVCQKVWQERKACEVGGANLAAMTRCTQWVRTSLAEVLGQDSYRWWLAHTTTFSQGRRWGNPKIVSGAVHQHWQTANISRMLAHTFEATCILQKKVEKISRHAISEVELASTNEIQNSV